MGKQTANYRVGRIIGPNQPEVAELWSSDAKVITWADEGIYRHLIVILEKCWQPGLALDG